MSRFTFSLAFLLIAACAQAQSPRLALIAGAGAWQGKLGNRHAYVEYAPVPQLFANLGLGTKLQITRKLLFAPEAGLEFQQWNYQFSTQRDPRQLVAHLSMFATRLSPGLELSPCKGLTIRAAVSFLIAFAAKGEVQIITFFPTQGLVVTSDYQNQFGRIRNWGNVGPEINLGYVFASKNGDTFGPRISGFIGKVPLLNSKIDTPVNLGNCRLSLDFIYTFGRCA
jgi:hypothetical protein